MQHILDCNGIGIVPEYLRLISKRLHQEPVAHHLVICEACRKQDVGKALVVQRDVEDIVVIRDFDLVFFLFVIGFTGLRIGISDSPCPGLRPVPGLHSGRMPAHRGCDLSGPG